MFGRKKSGSQPHNRINSLIGADTRVEGHIAFSGGLRVDGQIRGDVRAEGEHGGTLVISENARIEGRVSACHVIINGTVIGSVCAAESLELHPGARVTADVEYHRLEMQLGAVVQGRLVHRARSRSVELKLASSN